MGHFSELRFRPKNPFVFHITPNFVNDPFVALGEMVHFQSSKRFLDFSFPSYCGALSASNSPSAGWMKKRVSTKLVHNLSYLSIKRISLQLVFTLEFMSIALCHYQTVLLSLEEVNLIKNLESTSCEVPLLFDIDIGAPLPLLTKSGC